jgi:hypothetical protein
MSIAAEFASRGIVRGGILILDAHEALAMVARAREVAVPILGVDGFWITIRQPSRIWAIASNSAEGRRLGRPRRSSSSSAPRPG